MDIHVFIQKKLRDEGYTQPALAKKIGISQGTVSNLLTGATNIRADIKYKVARAFGLDPAAFDDNTVIAEKHSEYIAPLTANERRLLNGFRQLDRRRQERILETLDDLVLARKESLDTDPPGCALSTANSGQR